MAENKDNRKVNKNKNIINIITLGVFVLIIILADIFLIFDHEKTFSGKENRVLQTAPDLTVSGLTSGKYMTQVEDFVSDQFFARDGWITYKLTADSILGKKEANGVFIGSNGYLIENAASVDEKNFEKNINAIERFCNGHNLNVVMAVIPNAVSVCDYLLPAGAPVSSQSNMINRIKNELGECLDYVDVTETLKEHNKEYIYYKSDHHWTSLGAKYAFDQIAPYISINDPVSDYAVYCVTDSFSGTLASASGASYVKDDIEIYVPETDIKYVVEYVGENMKTATIYSSDALETNSKYEVFLKGNHPLINIKTTSNSDKNLLIVKDSYANAFVQFLLPYFKEIYIVDPRYYSDDIEKVISDGTITDVLFLYNLNTFVEDNSIAGVFEEQ